MKIVSIYNSKTVFIRIFNKKSSYIILYVNRINSGYIK